MPGICSFSEQQTAAIARTAQCVRAVYSSTMHEARGLNVLCWRPVTGEQRVHSKVCIRCMCIFLVFLITFSHQLNSQSSVIIWTSRGHRMPTPLPLGACLHFYRAWGSAFSLFSSSYSSICIELPQLALSRFWPVDLHEGAPCDEEGSNRHRRL